MASIRDAFLAKDTVLSTVQSLRSIAALPRELEDLREKYVLPAFEFLPKIDVLQNAFATLGSDDSTDRDVAPVRRGTLYGIVRAGFASITLRQALVPLRNLSGDSVGQLIFDWMQSQLDRFRIELRSIERLQPPRAVDACITQIRLALADSGVQSCDPENLKLLACRGPYPDDTEYITTVTAAGDFPRTLGQLAQIYDPRQWDVNHNPYATHFLDVHPVTSVNGQTPVNRPEPIGASWASPSFILENVAGVSGTSLANTLSVEFIATPGSLNLTYDLGRTTASSSTLVMERDFGHITVKPVPGRAGWSRVEMEKNIRFSGNTGTNGGDIGWGDLANLLAPDLVAHWLHDMRYMPCAV